MCVFGFFGCCFACLLRGRCLVLFCLLAVMYIHPMLGSVLTNIKEVSLDSEL